MMQPTSSDDMLSNSAGWLLLEVHGVTTSVSAANVWITRMVTDPPIMW